MMHRSSGELSSGHQGAETARALAFSKSVVSAYLRRPCCVARPLWLSHSGHVHSVSINVLIMHPLRRQTVELMDCKIALKPHLGGE